LDSRVSSTIHMGDVACVNSATKTVIADSSKQAEPLQFWSGSAFRYDWQYLCIIFY
jgi:hypothetical protein